MKTDIDKWFHTHTHSHYSALDAMSDIPSMAAKAKAMGQRAVSLTDHGNMAGAATLYSESRKHGLTPFIGVEAYVMDPNIDERMLVDKSVKDIKRYHLCLMARNWQGYTALNRLVSKTFTRPRFSKFPRMLISDLMEFGRDHGDNVVLTTGCYFGLVNQVLVNDSEQAAENVVKMYHSVFPHTFVELQNHCIDHDGVNDDNLVDQLVGIADRLGLPSVITQDSHYLDQADRVAHTLLKRMVYSTLEDGFPGDYYHFASGEWMAEHYTDAVWNRSIESYDRLLDLNQMTFPPIDNYKVHVPRMSDTPDEKLREIVEAELVDYLEGHTKEFPEYQERLNEELDVIKDIGFANYFLLARKVVKWCQDNKICVEARGSANSCLVCFLLGVTQTDPVSWNIDFFRFISRERKTPPDIDLDIDDSRRGEVLEFLAREFPSCQIGTFSKVGITIDEETGEERGSVLVSYLAYLRRKAKAEAERQVEELGGKKKDVDPLAKEIFKESYGDITTIDDVKKISRRDYKGLKRIAEMDSVYKSYGVHAAGVLLGTEEVDLDDVVPRLLVASSDTTVTAFDMDTLEAIGLLKFDILGQSSLRVMSLCQQLMGVTNPNDFSWIPNDDKKATAILRSGLKDNGIFHFGSAYKARGGKEMGIKSTKDTVLSIAAYMPGCVKSGQKDRYVESRKNSRLRKEMIEEARQLHPIIADVLSDTNGVMVYQDHPLGILKKLGMSTADVNVAYKVLKDSGKGSAERNKVRLDQLRKTFDVLCEEKGVTDPDKVWDMVAGFMGYGFNKAHSTGYGIRAYRTAYLKAHYPLEFMAATLQVWSGKKVGGRDMEKIYVTEARRIGLRCLPPDVNISGESWTVDRKANALRRGLRSVTGVGPSSALEISEARPFDSVEDLCTRVSSRALSGAKEYLTHGTFNGRLKALYDAGALESLLDKE